MFLSLRTTSWVRAEIIVSNRETKKFIHKVVQQPAQSHHGNGRSIKGSPVQWKHHVSHISKSLVQSGKEKMKLTSIVYSIYQT